MLFALKPLFLILCVEFVAMGFAHGHYFSEAREIVNSALEAASMAQTCQQGAEIVHQAESKIRQTLLSSNKNEALQDRGAVGIYPKLLVFVSLSMDEDSLKSLSQQAALLGGTLVLRGLNKGSFQVTAQKLKDLSVEVIIDPPLFEAYPIKSVPTFILRTVPTENAEDRVIHDRLTGNVSLEYVLEQFAQKGDTQLEAVHMLRILRGEL